MRWWLAALGAGILALGLAVGWSAVETPVEEPPEVASGGPEAAASAVSGPPRVPDPDASRPSRRLVPAAVEPPPAEGTKGIATWRVRAVEAVADVDPAVRDEVVRAVEAYVDAVGELQRGLLAGEVPRASYRLRLADAREEARSELAGIVGEAEADRLWDAVRASSSPVP